MPFFITKYARKTWSVYLVEAEDPKKISSDEGEYLGYFDDDGDGYETAGPLPPGKRRWQAPMPWWKEDRRRLW